MHPELMNRCKDSQTCSLYVSRMMMSKIFDVRWYQARLSADEPLSDKVLEGLQKSKLKDSVQLQTVLALYGPETVRNKKQTSYSRLKTSVRFFFDQKMRSRNLKARNDMIHGGVVTRSRKDNKANVERKVGDCWQWQATGQCSEGDSCGFHHGVRASGNGSELLKQKERTSSLGPNSKATKDGKGKSSDEKDGKSFDKRNKIPCQWRNCTNPSCGYRHPPECQNYISQIGCRYGKTCLFDMLSWRKSPTRSRRKEVRMDQLQVREALLSSDKSQCRSDIR